MARLFVTLCVVLIAIVAVLGASGVLQFDNTKDKATITVDKEELKNKADEAVQETKATGGKILDKTSETLHKAADDLRGDSSQDRQTPRETPSKND